MEKITKSVPPLGVILTPQKCKPDISALNRLFRSTQQKKMGRRKVEEITTDELDLVVHAVEEPGGARAACAAAMASSVAEYQPSACIRTPRL
ncbi:hypothetical protein E2562_023800 [Oryza meyeriana var. granulata]|uniref:Uncharacterized protein n=1 Tax=Oryza meyeriana var. granulata TaxID=110450 RepID=A0A6G1C6V6_9ORYZ|nr:hypothetical protein E2562_023800 [Oryza meyeriana var. granulata]